MPYEKDRAWSDMFIPEIKQILGEFLIKEAPIVEDMMHNTDLIVFELGTVRIACRIRKYSFCQNYGDQFTLRYSRPNDKETEFQKMLNGYGDYFFYGFSNSKEDKLYKWIIGDLNKLRTYINDYANNNDNKLPGIIKSNKDKSSEFIIFHYDSIPDFVVYSSDIKRGYKEIDVWDLY